MKAQILYEIGDIRYTDTNMPETGEGQALVRITRWIFRYQSPLKIEEKGELQEL